MTLAELRESARGKADESESDFITNSELNGYVNQGARIVHGKIVQSFNDDFLIIGTALNGGLFSTVVGTQNYALPDSMKKLVKLEARFNGSTSDNDWKRIEKVNIGNERVDTYYPIREGYYPGFGYFLTKDYIYLRPVPAQVFQVRVWFVPRFTTLVADIDIPDVPDEFHDLISEFAAIQCLRKSGEGIYKEAMDVFNLELKNMLETVQHRDQQPEQMGITDDYIYERY